MVWRQRKSSLHLTLVRLWSTVVFASATKTNIGANMAAEENRSKLVRISVRNIGCIGNDPVDISLDNVVCLVGRNNAGKSTILRAYELAKGTISFELTRDRHIQAQLDHPSEVILEVHIPDGIGNIAPEWKIEDGALRIVKSRWQWTAPSFLKVRTTWNPTGGADKTGDWDPDKNAAGLDNVFTSRLPRPLRVGSLDDAEKTEEMLLTLALTPLIASLEKERQNAESALSKAISSITANINDQSAVHEGDFNKIAAQVTEGFKSVFPSLGVRLNIASAPFTVRLDDLVKKGSGLRISDGEADTSLAQQGTGARRALFWAMLQVHNKLTREKEVRAEFQKNLEKELADQEKKVSEEDNGRSSGRDQCSDSQFDGAIGCPCRWRSDTRKSGRPVVARLSFADRRTGECPASNGRTRGAKTPLQAGRKSRLASFHDYTFPVLRESI